MANYIYVPALDSRPILDAADGNDVMILYGSGADSLNRYTLVTATLQAFAQAAGKPGFDWLPYAIASYKQNIMQWTAGGGNKVYFSGWVSPNQVVNGIVSQAAASDPIWQHFLYSPTEIQEANTKWVNDKQAVSTGGGVLSQVFSGIKNIASVLALPAALLALPALLGQPTLYSAIAANVSGAAAIPPAVDPTAATISQGESAATAVQNVSSLDVTDLSNLASGGAGSVDVGATVAATPVDTAALSGSVDIATGATIPASITAAADATGTSLQSIAENALKSLTSSPTTAAKYAAGLLATMGAGAPKPAQSVAVAPKPGIGNPLMIGAAALLLLAVVKRK